MSSRTRHTRRRFLKLSAKAAAAGTVASHLAISRFAHAAGSGTIRVGVVGCGGRGTGAAVNALSAGPDIRLVAMGDVFEDRASRGLRTLRQKARARVDVPRERLFVGFDAYKHVLQSGVDLVILATPPGFRPLHFEAAVQAGKHVFMEKSFAVDAPAYRKLLAANEVAKQKSLKVGTGLQFRHDKARVETVRRIHAGAIGAIRSMEAYWRLAGMWVRPRTDGQSEMEYQMTNWMYFVWLSGDIIVEYFIHHLDMCHWAKDAHPVRARGSGGRKERYGPDHGEIFDHFRVEYTYADGSPLLSECSMLESVATENRLRITGTLGTAEVTSGEIEGRTTWKYDGVNNNPYEVEQAALIDAIRNDTPYNDVESGAVSNMMCIMGRMAAYEDREITWDEAVNSNEAYLPQRYAWDAEPPTLPDKFGDYVVPAGGKRHSA